MVHGDIETPNLMELSDYVTKLAGIGINLLPDERMESYLRGVAHLPQKTDELIEEQEQKQNSRCADATDADATDGCPNSADADASRGFAVRPATSCKRNAYQSMARAQAAGDQPAEGLAVSGEPEDDAGAGKP